MNRVWLEISTNVPIFCCLQSPSIKASRPSFARLSELDTNKQLELQRQHALRLREQLEKMKQRQEETDLFASEERDIIEKRVEELEQEMVELSELVEEKNQIINVYEETIINHR
jgi:hypothetical protein